jgi:hypothetical protein
MAWVAPSSTTAPDLSLEAHLAGLGIVLAGAHGQLHRVHRVRGEAEVGHRVDVEVARRVGGEVGGVAVHLRFVHLLVVIPAPGRVQSASAVAPSG